jgi:hypothetical protein
MLSSFNQVLTEYGLDDFCIDVTIFNPFAEMGLTRNLKFIIWIGQVHPVTYIPQ